MRFPESPRVVFATNPLVEVICQVRFPVILAIGTEAPAAFQDAIRHEFPVYERQAAPSFPPEIAQLLGSVSFPGSPETTTHWFRTAEGSSGISLGTQFVAVTERNYTEWSDFRASIELALDALSAVYAPAFFERVGLRYVDVVDRAVLNLADQHWGELVHASLSGLLGADASIRAAVRQTQSMALLDLDEPPGAAVGLRTALESADRYVIDADFFLEDRKEREDAARALDLFNIEAGRLFRWAIREPVREALGIRHG